MERIELKGSCYGDRLIIKFNPKNIEFIASIDGTGDTFTITREDLKQLLGG